MSTYRGRGIPWVKGSVCFILKFALPLFPPLTPSECKFHNKTRIEAFNPVNNMAPALSLSFWLLRISYTIPGKKLFVNHAPETKSIESFECHQWSRHTRNYCREPIVRYRSVVYVYMIVNR